MTIPTGARAASHARLGRVSPFVEVVLDPESGRERVFGRYRIAGCDYRSLDWTSGVRAYQGDIFWFGGYAYEIGSHFLGAPIDAGFFPADVQEYDGLPTLLEAVRLGAGAYPRLISTDRASFVRAVAEFLTRRAIGLVAPERILNGRPNHRSWRLALIDEDGIPRCQFCRGPGNPLAPGDGLDWRGPVPAIRFHCAFPRESGCYQQQRISCDLEWLKALPLPPLSELYQAMLGRHGTNEHVFSHTRQLYDILGTAVGARLDRAGLPAQRLRTHAALFLLWFQIALHNGWLEALVIPLIPNEATPVRLSGIQDRRSGAIREPGLGTVRLRRLMAKRDASGADYPYGPAAKNADRRLDEELGL